MSTSVRVPHDVVVAELIRNGLPAEYARRAGSELADHYRDLVEEMQSAGWTEPYAASEAWRRLGDPRQLAKKTVQEFRKRYWCGRWPLVTFLLGPVPSFLLGVFLTGLVAVGIGELLGKGESVTPIQTWVEYAVAYSAKIWLTIGIPMLVVVQFCWLARRAALGRIWPCLSGTVLAVFVGFVQCHFTIHPTEANASVFWVGYYVWFIPECWNLGLLRFFWNDAWQLVQLVLPLAVTTCLLLYFSLQIRRDSRSHAAAG